MVLNHLPFVNPPDNTPIPSETGTPITVNHLPSHINAVCFCPIR